MKRYIKCPPPRKLVAITGQEVRAPGETETATIDMEWFATRLLVTDPRYSANGFESVLIAVETLRALRSSVDGVIELDDSPHWKLLADVARAPLNKDGKPAYDLLLAEINAEFAQAIIGATLEDPRVQALAAE